jgi:hypothetical protein
MMGERETPAKSAILSFDPYAGLPTFSTIKSTFLLNYRSLSSMEP